MKTIVVLCALLISLPALAGTFRDNFDDGNFEGWMETFGGNPNIEPDWKVQNGALIGRRDSGWCVHLTIGDADRWRDYTIECDVRVTERIQNEWGGILHYAGVVGRFRHENRLTHDGIWVSLNLKVPPTVWEGVIVTQNNLWVWLRDVETPFNAQLNTWYHLKSVIKVDAFKFYVDDALVTSFNSGAIPTGQVGICIGVCTAEFDNIVITGDDVPDTGPNGFSVKPKDKLPIVWAKLKDAR
ncbi:hypothetical protein FJZ31_37325 [Candidatus Poribacteria bacterium]|nr:hypothetical protein [Candidatus Poribacteria bacterium]